MINLEMTNSGLGYTAIAMFVIAYIFVMTEELHHLRKAKPVVFASGIIWALVAYSAKTKGASVQALESVKHALTEYIDLLLFILVAMTYVSALQERRVFLALKGWMVRKQLGYRTIFWITGILSFLISPLADNMTTALVMSAVILAINQNNARFISVCCINIVVAANAGGAFSPFGDITTLMVWQKGVVEFSQFFHLFIPALVNFLLPSFIMQFAIEKGKPPVVEEHIPVLPGGYMIIGLFLATILTAVTFNHYLTLPASIGMMTGFGYLQIYSYFLGRQTNATEELPFDIFSQIQKVEWDTLLFFYGIMLCIAGLAAFGYLELSANVLYHELGHNLSAMHQQTPANVIIGLLSAVIDNIPLMFAVLTMDPHMSIGQWLLVTLTAGVGGSVLSVGSAAGVALMGQAKQHYTFLSHLKWSWVILIGYFASIIVHFWINHDLFVSHQLLY